MSRLANAVPGLPGPLLPTRDEARASVTAIFDEHAAAEQAVSALRQAGVDLARLSIVGKDYHTEERPVGFYTLGDRVRVWGRRGAFWGGLAGLLVSPAMFLLPALGHVIVLGPLTAAVVGALEGAAVAGGLSALGAALVGLGVPRDSVLRFETVVRADRFLLVVHGDADADRAAELLRDAGAELVERHGGESP